MLHFSSALFQKSVIAKCVILFAFVFSFLSFGSFNQINAAAYCYGTTDSSDCSGKLLGDGCSVQGKPGACQPDTRVTGPDYPCFCEAAPVNPCPEGQYMCGAWGSCGAACRDLSGYDGCWDWLIQNCSGEGQPPICPGGNCDPEPPYVPVCNASCDPNGPESQCNAGAGQKCMPVWSKEGTVHRCRYAENPTDPACNIPTCETVRFRVRKLTEAGKDPVTLVYEAKKDGSVQLLNGGTLQKFGVGDQIASVDGMQRVRVEDGDQIRVATRISSVSKIRNVRYITTPVGAVGVPVGKKVPVFMTPIKHDPELRRIVFSRRPTESTTGKKYSQTALRKSRVDYRVDLSRVNAQVGEKVKNDITFRARVGQNLGACQAVVRLIAEKPFAPVCNSITMRNLNRPDDTTNIVRENDLLQFTCGAIQGATRYEFRVLEPGQGVAYLEPSQAGGTTSKPYTVSKNGDYVGQCRPCSGKKASSCMAWEDENPSPTQIEFQAVTAQEPEFASFGSDVLDNLVQ